MKNIIDFMDFTHTPQRYTPIPPPPQLRMGRSFVDAILNDNIISTHIPSADVHRDPPFNILKYIYVLYVS